MNEPTTHRTSLKISDYFRVVLHGKWYGKWICFACGGPIPARYACQPTKLPFDLGYPRTRPPVGSQGVDALPSTRSCPGCAFSAVLSASVRVRFVLELVVLPGVFVVFVYVGPWDNTQRGI